MLSTYEYIFIFIPQIIIINIIFISSIHDIILILIHISRLDFFIIDEDILDWLTICSYSIFFCIVIISHWKVLITYFHNLISNLHDALSIIRLIMSILCFH